MPDFGEGGLDPLEYVIPWQGNLEPPPLLIVHNCLSVDAEANLSDLLVADGEDSVHMSNALFSCDF